MRQKREKPAQVTLPKPGEVFLMPLEDGRFGACRVIRENTAQEREGHGCAQILVAASPWIGSAAPDLRDPQLREIHKLTHHSWNNPNMLWIDGPPPRSFRRIGVIEPSAGDKRRKCWASGGWCFDGQLYMQWRWDHDHEAVLREDKVYEEQQAREYENAEKRRREQLGGLTLDGLKKKRRFTDWRGFVPAKALTGSRVIFREAIETLIALGPKPRKPAVLTVLKECVEKLNKLDAEHDHFIETTVAEDLCDAIDEIAYASGLRMEETVADRWRDW